MGLDRGVVAKLDRRLLAALAQDERFQMVRVPITPAKWSTWKRYCEAAGIAMGRAIAALIDRELVVVFGDLGVDGSPVLAQQADARLSEREVELARGECDLDATEERLRRWSEQLSRWEVDLEVRERRADALTKSCGLGNCSSRGRRQRRLPVRFRLQVQAVSRPRVGGPGVGRSGRRWDAPRVAYLAGDVIEDRPLVAEHRLPGSTPPSLSVPWPASVPRACRGVAALRCTRPAREYIS